MADRPVAFYDSGIGGLPYLAWVRERLPNAPFVYVGDNEHFPYGEKSHEELRMIAVSVVGRILARFDPKLVVVACNTASVVALAELRARFPVAFVGVVPAVKPAAERSRGRRIALLATTRTVGDAYSDRLIQEYAADCTVVRIAGQQLVSFIENDYIGASPVAVMAALEPTIAPLRSEKVDSVILGCTHFTFLDREIREGLGGGVDVIDSREGVGRQVLRLFGNHQAQHADGIATSPAEGFLYHTAPDNGRYRKYSTLMKLTYGGILE
jgi:glutamate racemase